MEHSPLSEVRQSLSLIHLLRRCSPGFYSADNLPDRGIGAHIAPDLPDALRDATGMAKLPWRAPIQAVWQHCPCGCQHVALPGELCNKTS